MTTPSKAAMEAAETIYPDSSGCGCANCNSNRELRAESAVIIDKHFATDMAELSRLREENATLKADAAAMRECLCDVVALVQQKSHQMGVRDGASSCFGITSQAEKELGPTAISAWLKRRNHAISTTAGRDLLDRLEAITGQRDNLKECWDTAIAKGKLDKLTAEVERLAIMRDKVWLSAHWSNEHSPGTPVPDWATDALNGPPRLLRPDALKGEIAEYADSMWKDRTAAKLEFSAVGVTVHDLPMPSEDAGWQEPVAPPQPAEKPFPRFFRHREWEARKHIRFDGCPPEATIVHEDGTEEADGVLLSDMLSWIAADYGWEEIHDPRAPQPAAEAAVVPGSKRIELAVAVTESGRVYADTDADFGFVLGFNKRTTHAGIVAFDLPPVSAPPVVQGAVESEVR